MIILPILTTSHIHFSSKGFENVIFYLGSERVNLWALLVGNGTNALKDYTTNSHYYLTYTFLFNPFTPESDKCQNSPAASQEIWHHTVWRTWLFIAYSDEKWLYYKFSLHHSYNSFLKGWENTLFELRTERVKRLGECTSHVLLVLFLDSFHLPSKVAVHLPWANGNATDRAARGLTWGSFCLWNQTNQPEIITQWCLHGATCGGDRVWYTDWYNKTFWFASSVLLVQLIPRMLNKPPLPQKIPQFSNKPHSS